MSASLCTVFEVAVPPHGTLGGDNPAVLRRQRQLDRVAADNGLTPLNAFLCEDDADHAAAPPGLPPAQWFPASAGALAVRALIDHLTAHPNAVSSQADVLAELVEIEKELADAERAGVQFRFAVVS